MTTEDRSALPPSPPEEESVLAAGLEVAMKWGAALGGPDQLDVALKALEPQMKREHQLKLKHLEFQREVAERAARLERERRSHTRHLAGLAVGAVLAVAMLGAGVYVAKDAWWLSALLCGPSLLALAKIFVLRRSDPEDMRFVSKTARNSTNAASQAQPPVV
ncbi:hypothetical protein [Streptomyces sp. 3N207]|uniref:hypothetical protein n=1 Tax=Streptomyces sp. 3N207 TaxID=3457417 RepID=UPI003FD1824E